MSLCFNWSRVTVSAYIGAAPCVLKDHTEQGYHVLETWPTHGFLLCLAAIFEHAMYSNYLFLHFFHVLIRSASNVNLTRGYLTIFRLWNWIALIICSSNLLFHSIKCKSLKVGQNLNHR